VSVFCRYSGGAAAETGAERRAALERTLEGRHGRRCKQDGHDRQGSAPERRVGDTTFASAA